MELDLRLRRAGEEDLPTLAALYAESVRSLGPEHYRPDVVEAWASSSAGPGFRGFVLDHDTWVAVGTEGILGFGGIDDRGRFTSAQGEQPSERRRSGA